MGTMTILRSMYPRLTGQLKRPTDVLGRIGDHMLFYIKALGGVPHAAIHFRREIIRLIAEISMGAGTLAMIGGTVVIVGFLTLAAGGTLAVQGYSSLGNIGIEALTGFLAAFINVRISAPVVAGIGLGLIENWIGGFFEIAWQEAAVFVIMIAVLFLRPDGLFKRGGMRVG